MRFASKGEIMQIKNSMQLAFLGLSFMGFVASAAAADQAAASMRSNSPAGDVYAISHPGLILTAAELRDVYLGEKQFAGSTRLVPVDNSSIQDIFLEKAIYIETYKYAALWIRKSFRGGLVPPLTKANDLEVISYVKNTAGAVGYISTPPPSGVTQLFKY